MQKQIPNSMMDQVLGANASNTRVEQPKKNRSFQNTKLFCVCLFSFTIHLNKEQSASEKNLAIFVEINFTTEHKSFFTASR